MTRELATSIAPSALTVGERARSDAEARIASMFETYFGVVWRFLRRLGVPAGDVDDCAQEVMVIAARKIEDIQLGKERAYLLGVAFRVASDARRTRSRRRETDFEQVDEESDAAHSPEILVDRARARAVLDEILAGMPVGFRVVFVLAEIEEMSMAEIADLLQVPQGTVASRLRRGREYFHTRAKRIQAGLANRGVS